MHLFAALILLLSSSLAFAAPLTQEELDRYNNILSALDTEQISVRLTAGERDEQTDRLVSVDTETRLQNEEGQDFIMSLGLERKSLDTVEFRGGVQGALTDKPISRAQIISFLALAHPIVTVINEKKRYLANLKHTGTRREARLFFTLTAQQQHLLFEDIAINATLPRRSEVISARLKGLLNTREELIPLIQYLMKEIHQAF